MTNERPDGDLPRTYSAEEVAPLLGLTPAALRQGCKRGRYAGRKIGGKWRFTAEDVAAIIADAGQQVNTERAHRVDANRRARPRRTASANTGSGTVTPFTPKPGPKRTTRRAV